MKYEFKVNGTVKLIIEPDNNIEREIFKELFSGAVTVEASVSTAPNGEIVISKNQSK